MSGFQLSSAKQEWALGFDFEDQARSEGFRFIAGVDEVGRGCLAGPVVAAACILDRSKPLPEGLDDSKKLTAAERERINIEIRDIAVAFGIGAVEADEIDRINILEATKKAMLVAIGALKPAADYLLIDALQLKPFPVPQKALIKGDSISVSIAAASVLAKTYRDALMQKYNNKFPEYGFSHNVGYATKDHYEALRHYGFTPIHRKTFRGVVSESEDSFALAFQ